MKKLNIIFALVFTSFLFYGCNVEKNSVKEDANVSKVSSINNTIAMPDGIIFYNHGKKIIIDKKDWKFNEIVSQAKTSLSKLSGRHKCVLDVNYEKSKGVLLEFTYNNTQEIECSNLENKEVIKYSNIYFNLESSNSCEKDVDLVDFGDEKGELGPVIEANALKNLLLK